MNTKTFAIFVTVLVALLFACKWMEIRIREQRYAAIVESSCQKHVSAKAAVPIVDTDGMPHYIIPFTVVPSGTSPCQDTEGHSLVFSNGKYYHGEEKTQCRKCLEKQM